MYLALFALEYSAMMIYWAPCLQENLIQEKVPGMLEFSCQRLLIESSKPLPRLAMQTHATHRELARTGPQADDARIAIFQQKPGTNAGLLADEQAMGPTK